MLIRLYGEFWNPDSVDWGKRGPGNKGKLMGKLGKGKASSVDMWDARGIYALYDNFKLVYIGVAVDQAIGKRLRDHLTDRLAGRWDMFSWYSISTLRKKKPRVPGQRQLKPIEIISTLEAFGIAIVSPPLNRRFNEIPNAREVLQAKSPHPHTVRNYLEKIIEKIDKLEK